MNSLKDALKEQTVYNDLIEYIKTDRLGTAEVIGCGSGDKGNFISALSDNYLHTLVIVGDEKKAKEIYDGIDLHGNNVYLYPEKDLLFLDADIHGDYILKNRLSTIRSIVENEKSVIIATVGSLMDKLMPLDKIRENYIRVSDTDRIDIDDMKNKLVNMSYERVEQVESPGQFAVRGEIIDIFPMTEETPIRIDLWDDEIDSMKYFDVDSQRSVDSVSEIKIYPATEYILTREEIEKGIEKILKEKDKVIKAGKKQLAELKNLNNINIAESLERISSKVTTFVDDLKNNITLDTASFDSYVAYFYPELSSLIDYLKDEETIIIFDNPVEIEKSGKEIYDEYRRCMDDREKQGYILPGQKKAVHSYNDIIKSAAGKFELILSPVDSSMRGVKTDKKLYMNVKPVVGYGNNFSGLIKDIKKYKSKKYRVLLLVDSAAKGKRFAKELEEYDINALYTENKEREIAPGEVIVMTGTRDKGFEYSEAKFVVLTGTEMFGVKRNTRKKEKKKYSGKYIRDFSELKPGDYVVHENHGIGIYKGLDKLTVDGVEKDYIKIGYGDNSNLYILSNQLDMLQKFADRDAKKKPKLSKLNSVEWKHTKSKVKGAVAEVAKDLVKLYYERQQEKGYEFSKDNQWQEEFENSFPYEETKDQLQAINDTKKDMESKKIMDRLICGDVGFGKTEVAIRAAFKAVQDGKQVALLAPTTILVRQHYETFKSRMKGYPIRIDMLSRFSTTGEIKDTIEGLKTGEVDIVIGTHKLFNKKVKYKDLGLLVIDEEQRFGVTHKEKIKQMKENVDVISLSATPIPRTLHMSLVGIRDMSVLEEPPMDRIPIQTYVMPFDKEMIREAINRELARGGQVYYVYNRVNSIESVCNMVRSIVPEANVEYAHGRMGERRLEEIMYDFIEGDIDVLVSTTIIETGLDIPNVNTIIIQEADKFGLSQLYQLRGRVGRTTRAAYAFLLYKESNYLTQDAMDRLEAIREFKDLGSGVKIAMRDLEIRGAGNVLGVEQHGHMEAVGYDLYCKFLDEAIKKEKGIEVMDDFETKIDIDIDAYIPSDYIRNEKQKLNVYKRIASIETEEDYYDMRDEIMDRFGDMPAMVEDLVDIAYIKAMAHRAYITEISNLKTLHGKRLRIIMNPEGKIKGEKIPPLITAHRGTLKFAAGEKPEFIYDLNPGLNRKEYKEKIKGIIEEIAGLQ